MLRGLALHSLKRMLGALSKAKSRAKGPEKDRIHTPAQDKDATNAIAPWTMFVFRHVNRYSEVQPLIEVADIAKPKKMQNCFSTSPPCGNSDIVAEWMGYLSRDKLFEQCSLCPRHNLNPVLLDRYLYNLSATFNKRDKIKTIGL